MITKVGTQDAFSDAVRDLLELDYDAIEAYELAIKKLTNEDYKKKLVNFKKDHERHTRELSLLLKSHEENVPAGPSGKQWLSKGKVLLGGLLGDEKILQAMISNETDTNTAYERMAMRKDKWKNSQEIFHQGLEDEQRHKAWLESVVKKQ